MEIANSSRKVRASKAIAYTYLCFIWQSSLPPSIFLSASAAIQSLDTLGRAIGTIQVVVNDALNRLLLIPESGSRAGGSATLDEPSQPFNSKPFMRRILNMHVHFQLISFS